MSDLYFDDENDYSEENASNNEDFHPISLQLFQFETTEIKRVVLRAMRKKLQKQLLADILQFRCS